MASSTFGSMTLTDLNTLRNDLKGWENWELTELLHQSGTTDDADVANTIEYLRKGLLLLHLPPDVDMNTMTLEEAVRMNDENAAPQVSPSDSQEEVGESDIEPQSSGTVAAAASAVGKTIGDGLSVLGKAASGVVAFGVGQTRHLISSKQPPSPSPSSRTTSPTLSSTGGAFPLQPVHALAIPTTLRRSSPTRSSPARSFSASPSPRGWTPSMPAVFQEATPSSDSNASIIQSIPSASSIGQITPPHLQRDPSPLRSSQSPDDIQIIDLENSSEDGHGDGHADGHGAVTVTEDPFLSPIDVSAALPAEPVPSPPIPNDSSGCGIATPVVFAIYYCTKIPPRDLVNAAFWQKMARLTSDLFQIDTLQNPLVIDTYAKYCWAVKPIGDWQSEDLRITNLHVTRSDGLEESISLANNRIRTQYLISAILYGCMKGTRKGRINGTLSAKIDNYDSDEESPAFYDALYKYLMGNLKRILGKERYTNFQTIQMANSLDIVTYHGNAQGGNWHLSTLPNENGVVRWDVFLNPKQNQVPVADRLWLFGYYLATEIPLDTLPIVLRSLGDLRTVDDNSRGQLNVMRSKISQVTNV